jgi:acyl-CoA thioesterase
MKEIKDFFKGDKFAAYNNCELLEAGPGSAKAKMTLHPHHLNGLGTVHGGAIFMKAARTGILWAEAREISKNFKVGSYAVEIKDDQGDLVAQFQGLAYRKKDRLPFAPPGRADLPRQSATTAGMK